MWQKGTTGGPPRGVDGQGDFDTEEWFASYLGGVKIGYARRGARWVTEDGRRLRQVDEFHSLSAMKGADPVRSTITSTEWLTDQGNLVRFRHEIRQSKQPLVVTGQVRGNRLEIEQTSIGINTTRVSPCSERLLGALGLEQNLSEPPIRPGESRSFEAFTAGSLDIGQHSLRAGGYEETPLLDARRKLLRVEWIANYAQGMKLRSTVWVDEEGRWQKQRNEDLGLETYRVSKEEALAPAATGGPNLLFDTLIKIERPINPAAAKAIRYRIRLESGDPAQLFVASPLQTVKSVDSQTAEVTVRAVDSSTERGGTDADRPTESDRTASAMIQSDDPAVVALAGEVPGQSGDTTNLAKALARHVHAKMKQVDYSQAFATAAEVARELKGDCSEHAVLLAALLRARGAAARVAIGLVYVPSSQAFGYHMWTECWTGQTWLPLDATLGQVTGATHLKIAATSLSAGVADPSFVQVARLLGGKPKIEVMAVE